MIQRPGIAVLFAAALMCQASEPAAARWEGLVQIPGRDLTLVIDLAQDSEGHWIGSAIVPGFGIKGAPLVDIAIQDSGVSFAMKGALGEPKFKGHLSAAGELTGDFQQAGNTAPFILHKAGPAQVDLPRESSTVAKEMEGEWQGEMDLMGRTIHVTLKLANQANGRAAGQIRFVGRRDTTVPIDLVTQDADMLTLELRDAGMIYEARFRKDANEITGTLRQGPLETPLTLLPAPKSATDPAPKAVTDVPTKPLTDAATKPLTEPRP